MAAGGFVSKEEYLKRYLSGADTEEKKKKRKRRPKGATSLQPRMKIFDDDITVNDVAPTTQQTEEAEELYLDEGPTIEGMVDDRPEDVQQMETFTESKQWKKLGGKGERHDSDSDSDAAPTRRQRHDSGSDESQGRRERHDSGSDQSPVRRERHDSGSDQSPVRKQRHDSGSDQSPVRRQRQDSDSDQSPPRRQKQGKSKHASDSDQSPPRRKQNSDSDQSPPRKQQRDSDSDLSPPRKSGKSEDSGKSSRRQRPSRFAPVEKPDKDDKGRSKKTLSGLTAGLSTARAMRMENDAKRKREQDMFDMADDSTLGKGARTVFRDKETGRRRNLAKESEAEAKENAIKEELLNKYKAWGKGLKQATQQNERVQEALHEADKPLARARGDDDLEDMLKDKERDGDPMLAYVRKKKQKTKSAVKDIPRYRGPQPPANRFNIWPGYRWDGVDRSNGFEKSLFQKGAERKAVAEDAYKWSIEDM